MLDDASLSEELGGGDDSEYGEGGAGADVELVRPSYSFVQETTLPLIVAVTMSPTALVARACRCAAP